MRATPWAGREAGASAGQAKDDDAPCGLSDYIEDSPATDEDCTPNPDAPEWDFRVAYEAWLDLSAFEPEGFGSAFMYTVHASPSKLGQNNVDVTPGECPCPPDYDTGECGPPEECTISDDCEEGQFCHEGLCLNVVT